MQSVTVDELKARLDELLEICRIEVALIGPEDDKQWALMPYDVYLQLRQEMRKAYKMSELPEDLRQDLLATLEPPAGKAD